MIRIYNMDCVQGAKKYLKDNSIDLITTDPPYNLGFAGTTHTKTKKPRFQVIENDRLSFREYQRFSMQWLKEAYRVLKPKRHIYVCIDWRMYAYMYLWMRHVGFYVKNCIVWDKKHIGMGWQYRYRHEMVIFATKQNEKVRRVKRRNAADIWEIKRIPGNQTKHPSEKPVEFFRMMIENSSEPGEHVADFFCGSGASVKASQELKRQFTGFEIDPMYYQQIKPKAA